MKFVGRIHRKGQERRGDVLVQGMVWLLLTFVLFVLIMEFTRIQIISVGIRDAVEQAVTSVAINNAYNSYNGVREGNSGAYKMTNDSWRENISTIDVQNKLISLLKLHSKNGVFMKPNPEGEGYEFKISNLNVTPSNAEFASNLQKAKYRATCTVEIPLSLGFEAFGSVTIQMEHKSIYIALFD